MWRGREPSRHNNGRTPPNVHPHSSARARGYRELTYTDLVHVSAEALIRLGYLSKAMVYILVGTLAVRVAAGLSGGRLTDPGGSLYVILQKPLGNTLLLLIAIGLLAYAAWRIGGAILRWRPYTASGLGDRALAILRALVYGLVGWKALKLTLGLFGGDTGTEGLVREALGWPFGEWVIAACAAGVGWYGLVEIKDAFQGHLEEDLDSATLRQRAGEWALNVARAGIGARGVILVLLAYGLFHAAIAHRPHEAAGMGTSLELLNALPQGALMLGATAAGLMAYGVYQLLHARYVRL